MKLIYKGNGFLIDVPAGDLTDEEVEKFGKEKLIKSGLYRPENKKAVLGGSENKIETHDLDEVK